MDSYEHKPSNDELLHDLMRVFGPPPTFAGATVVFKTDEERLRLSGPLERVMGAVDEYHADDARQQSLNTSPDGDAYIGMYDDQERQAWRQLCEILAKDEHGVDVSEADKLLQGDRGLGRVARAASHVNQTSGQRQLAKPPRPSTPGRSTPSRPSPWSPSLSPRGRPGRSRGRRGARSCP
jgi:hypothetical protein